MYIITQLICYVEWVFDVSNHACTQDTNETYRDVNEIALVIHPLKIIQIIYLYNFEWVYQQCYLYGFIYIPVGFICILCAWLLTSNTHST